MMVKTDVYSELYERNNTWVFTINENGFVHSMIEQFNGNHNELDFLGKVNESTFIETVKGFMDGMEHENFRVI